MYNWFTPPNKTLAALFRVIIFFAGIGVLINLFAGDIAGMWWASVALVSGVFAYLIYDGRI